MSTARLEKERFRRACEVRLGEIIDFGGFYGPVVVTDLRIVPVGSYRKDALISYYGYERPSVGSVNLEVNDVVTVWREVEENAYRPRHAL